jgi:o-succinylbenzoate---CoA ligase
MPATTPRQLVAVDLPPGRTFVAGLDAVWAQGDAVLPLPSGLPASQRAAVLEALRPAALLEASGVQTLPAPAPVPAGTAAVVTTSGSTGAPKGVVLSHDALLASARATADRIRQTGEDRWLCCLPLSHVAGLQVLIRSRLIAREPVLHPGFDPAAIGGTAATGDATLISVVPTMLGRLLDAGVDVSRFRVILLGGAAAPRELLARAHAAGARIVQTYGMTETCGGCVYDGVPLDGVEVQVGADGRIRIRGPVLLDGYRAPDEQAGIGAAPLDADGWFVTNDLGEWVDSRLAVLGRADDVIVTGGENVVAGQVEAVLAEHPGIRHVAVVGREDADWGQRVVAVVVPAGEPPTLEELRAHARALLPRPALPQGLELVAALPLLESGKIDRSALRDAPAPTEQR